MTTVDLSNQTLTIQELLKLADEDNLILKTADGREFVLAETDDLSRDTEQSQRNSELVQFLATRSGGLATRSLASVREDLGL